MPTSFKKVIHKVRTEKWWLEECPTSFFLFDYIMKTFVSAGRLLGRPTLKQSVFINKNNLGMELNPYDERKNNFIDIYQHELKTQGYFKKLFLPWFKIRQNLAKLNDLAINKINGYSSVELLRFAKEFLQLGFDSVVYGALLECVDPFTESLPRDLKLRYNLTNEQARDYSSILSIPLERSFLTQEKLDFYSLCLHKLTIVQYIAKYYWINSNYRQSGELELADLKKRIKNELKIFGGSAGIKKEIKKTLRNEKKLFSDKKAISQKLKLIKADKKLFKLLEIFGHYIDLRKESMLRHTYARDKFLLEISRRTNYKMDDLSDLDDQEIIKVIQKKPVNWRQIRLRHKLCVAYYTPFERKIFYGSEAKKIYQTFILSLKSDQLKGMVAQLSSRLIRGKVSLVLDIFKDKFKPGNILITTMTRPEFMPLMRRAKAVITDEGGLTCHAAIISRELKIPCIIGVKNATKVLKNNDFVEMDLKTGVIKKIINENKH
ncbi:MAG: PEP-utilizing enzyme [Patescibacteria group bacterium]|jgi:phosphohistidine swiveling domain-containing protein